MRIGCLRRKGPTGRSRKQSYHNLGADYFDRRISPDGTLLASASLDRTVWSWHIDPEVWAAHHCSIPNRNLSFSEWRLYKGPNQGYKRTCPDLPAGEGALAR